MVRCVELETNHNRTMSAYAEHHADLGRLRSLPPQYLPKLETKVQKESDGAKIGRAVSCALMRAVYEKRAVIGVAAAVKELLTISNDERPQDCSDVAFCVLAPAAEGDSGMHMQTTLLEAFCYENGIYIVKVDSARKLSRLLNVRHTQTCALIQRTWSSPGADGAKVEPPMSVSEEAMADHCEEFWDMQQPIVYLPD